MNTVDSVMSFITESAQNKKTSYGLILIVISVVLVLNTIGALKFSTVFFTPEIDTLVAFFLFGAGMATIYSG